MNIINVDSIYNISSVGTHHYQLGSVVRYDINTGNGNLNQLHLSYYNGSESNGKLQYSNINISTGIWETTVIDETATKVGLYSDIDLDSDGNPHISYFDATNNQIKYAKFDGISWTITVTSSVGSDSSHTAIAIDDLDRAHIAYRNSNNEKLELASWNGVDWTIMPQYSGGAGLRDGAASCPRGTIGGTRRADTCVRGAAQQPPPKAPRRGPGAARGRSRKESCDQDSVQD